MPFDTTEGLGGAAVADNRLPQRIHGVQVHGRGTFLYVIDTNSVCKGANQGKFLLMLLEHSSDFIFMLVVTILNDVLTRVNKGSPVDELSIQLDGASENWNKTLLSFGQLLLESGHVKSQVGIFREYSRPFVFFI